MSRDPIGEMGGANLYGFVGNDGVNWWDYLGLAVGRTTVTAEYGDAHEHFGIPVVVLCSEECDTSGVPAFESKEVPELERLFRRMTGNQAQIYLGRELKEGETLYGWYPPENRASALTGSASKLGHILDETKIEALKAEARADLDKKYTNLLEEFGLKNLPCEVVSPFRNITGKKGAYIYEVSRTGDPRQRPPLAPKPARPPGGFGPPPGRPEPPEAPDPPNIPVPEGDDDFGEGFEF